MKKSLLVLVAVLISVVAIAQAPQKMTYQAVVRDNNGRLVSNGNVGVRITIVRGSETGSAVYGQSETVRTNDNGLFTIMIGGNSFESIDWSNGPYYLKSEVDPDGGTNYILTTTQQMVSVPYALHAGTVDNIIGGVNFTETDPIFTAWDKDYNDLINKPTIPTNVSELANDAGYLTSFTETQVLSISSDTIFLTGGSYVKLPAGFSGDYNDLINRPNFADSVSRIVNEYHLGDTIINYISQNGYVDSSYVINYNTQQGYVDTTFVTNYVNNVSGLGSESDPVFTAWDKDYNDLINRPNFADSVSRIVNEYHLGDTIINYISQNGYVDSNYVINYNTQQGYVDTSYVTNYISNGGAVTSESDPVFAAWDKDYNDLINRPSLADSVSRIVNEYHLGDTIINYISQNGYVDSSYVINYNMQQGYVDTTYVTNYISNGGAVTSESDPVFTAWDKDYNDLINKPTIPTSVSELTNDAGYLTSFTEVQILSISNDTIFLTGGSFVKLPAGFSGDYNDLANKPTIPTVPENVSEFTNDAGYITDYTESQTLAAVTALGNSAGNRQLKQLADPTEAQDAVTKAYLDAIITSLRAELMEEIANGGGGGGGSTTPSVTITNGALPGVFSVSSSKTVNFSQGNLQYTTTGTHTVHGDSSVVGTWRFAERQYDCIGSANGNISSSYSGWIDLFGFGTSGWNSGANAYYPYSASSTAGDYGPGGNLVGQYADADWGIYNAISNGGNEPRKWRVLTHDEWDYLLNLRTTSTTGIISNARYCKATVAGVAGLIIFPDTYVHPTGNAPSLQSVNIASAAFSANSVSDNEWAYMEAAGAVFLPTAGQRNNTSVNNLGLIGAYRSSESVLTVGDDISWGGAAYLGCSVRLVTAISHTITTVANPVEGGTITGYGTYDEGSVVTLTAAATNAAYSFADWSDGETNASRNITVTGDATYTANFVYFDGVMPGVFSVSSSSTVRFSRGNLQYTTTGTHTVSGGGTETGTWRFAEQQYDYIGEANSNISSSYTGWIDLFGWGTSGWNSGANAYQPWATSTTYGDYSPGGDHTNNLTGTYAQADWGVYNAISNGGNQPGMWRTMTDNEWKYLLQTRSASTVGGTANARYAKARVNNFTPGVILFPDTFTLPTGLTVTNINNNGASYASNTYTASQWGQLEAAGCIFLPAAGYRIGTGVYYVGTDGYYWSSTYYVGRSVYNMYFSGDAISVNGYYRDYGKSVRLVQDVE